MSGSDRKLSQVHRRAVLKGFLIGGVSAVPFAGYALRLPRRPDEGPRGSRRFEREGVRPVSPTHGSATGSSTAPPWELLAPLSVGSYVGSGWRVRALSAIQQGVAVLTLAHLTGEVAEIHVCRRSGLARGLAHTAHLDFMLMNDGDGELPTPEGVGRAVKTVALRIARRERLEVGSVAPPHAMMSHWARVRWYGAPEAAA